MKTKKFPPHFVEALEDRIAPATIFVTTLKDITDPAHDTGSLRDAIFQANTNGGSNTIDFQITVDGKPAPVHGTIVLTSNLPTITNILTITGPISGKANGLIINAHGHQGLSVEGSSAGLILSDLTITKGVAEDGGGLYIDGGASSLTDVTISGNRAASTSSGVVVGGGIDIHTGTVTITKSKITGNAADGFQQTTSESGGAAYGGGIHCAGTLTITDSLVSGNVAKGGNGKSGAGDDAGSAYGGGIYTSQSTGDVTITDSKVIGNKVLGGNGGAGAKGAANAAGENGGEGGFAAGGGIYGYKGATTVISSLVSGNVAKGGNGGAGGAGGAGAKGGSGGDGGYAYGGGIDSGDGATTTIQLSTISGNSAFTSKGGAGGPAGSHGKAGVEGYSGGGYGGGVLTELTLTISQSAITKNSATLGGGVAVTASASASISDSTLALNHASGNGGGIDTLSSSVALNNDTIAKNRAGGAGGGVYVGGTNTMIGVISTIIAGNAAHTDADVSGELTASFDLIENTTGLDIVAGASNLTDKNPLLGALALHGGTTVNFLPSANSPVIGMGNNPNNLTDDQRGDSRTGSDNTVDIGSVEVV